MDFHTWLDEGKISECAFMKLSGKECDIKKIVKAQSELKISVIISTFRRKELLLRLLRSIKEQQYDNYEIIITDDSSNDGTEVEIKQYMEENEEQTILFETNKSNMGVGESKKKAYLKATGEIIIFSDDDDYFVDSSYFELLNRTYKDNPDCLMTIAPTITHYEKEDIYEIQELNTPPKMSHREYLNGFMTRYTKPNSMFTMSMRAESMKKVHFEQLQYFNDTPLYLFGLLGEGNVYTLREAKGIYYINGKNMTGNARLDYIIGNLEAKEDIFTRAKNRGLLDNAKEWHYQNIAITASYYLANNIEIREEDKVVWRWLRKHFDILEYIKFCINILRLRRRKGLPTSAMWINP